MNHKVVLFGGGTGLSNVLSALKNISNLDICAVVTIADNGGSTGKIRNFYDIPAPGDIRRCALALSDNQVLKELMNYRFDKNIDNHTIGNLILTALNDMYGNMQTATQEYLKILEVKQSILPISNDSLELCATMASGITIRGESQIALYPEKIKRLFYEGNPQILQEVLTVVNQADLIIFSCGSLYTSIISNLLFKDLINALDQAPGKIVYLCNLMTQRGETESYQVSDHINAINSHLNQHKVDVVIANNNYHVNNDIIANYQEEQARFVRLDPENINCQVIADDFVLIDEKQHIRHNVELICEYIEKLLDIKEGKVWKS